MAENKDKKEDLDRLKKDYEALRKKHSLPGFKELNEDFSIDKATESETDILIREIRRLIGDKLVNYMRFLENLINPMNAPMFIFSVIKLLEPEEKKKLSEIYAELMKKEVKFIELDLEFDEKKEGEFINDTYRTWQKIKKDLLEIMEKVNKKWDDKAETNSKGYFG